MASGGGEAGGGGLEEEESLLLFHRSGGETEALLRAAGAGQAGEEAAEAGDELDGEDPELRGLRRRLQGWLWPYGGLLMALQRLLVWERPLYSVCTALTLNTLFWLLSSTSLRPLFLLSVSLLGLVLLERWKHKLPLITVQHPEPEPSQAQREAGSVEPRLLSVSELSHHLADSYLTCCLYLQEMMQYKRLYHGKFCFMMCSGCAVLAVVGHYVPGIMISYIMALSVLLWPLVVYHELIQRMYTGLEPILMKLDYSMKGGAEHRKHDKRIITLLREVKKELEGDEPRAETESDSEEEELSCFSPTVDVKTTALAMAITDSELSDEEASILESGGFSVSRATTPQMTDLSEDLDQQSHHSDPDESFLRDLPEFPSVEEFPSIDHSLFHFPLRGSQGPQAPPVPQAPPGPQAPPAPQGPPGPQVDTAQAGQPSDGEPLSSASLLLQHLASPLHFVNTHFNGHSRPPGGEEGGPAPATSSVGLLLGGVAEEEEEEPGEEEEEGRGGAGVAACPAPPQPHRSPLEALSEEIVSTAISTVVQNTLSALLRSEEDQEDQEDEEDGGSLEPFLLPTQTLSSLDHHHLHPTETSSTPDRLSDVTSAEARGMAPAYPCHTQLTPLDPGLTPTETTSPSVAGQSPAVETLSPLEQTLPTETMTTMTSSSTPDVPEETSPGASETTTAAADHSRTAGETAPSPDLPTETTADPAGPPPETTTDEAAPAAAAVPTAAVTPAAVDEAEATTLAEDEDFELLDQSELEQAEEEGEGLGLVGGGASGATDTPPSPQRQPRES